MFHYHMTQTGIEIHWDVEIKTTMKREHNRSVRRKDARRKKLATD